MPTPNKNTLTLDAAWDGGLQTPEEALKEYGLNVLLTGKPGDGKTYMLRTMPRPIWIDSFDPDGGLGLRKWANKEYGIVVDNRWERDDPMKPRAFDRWNKEMAKRDESFYNGLGTYCIDSLTSFTDKISMMVMARLGRPGQFPAGFKNYEEQWKPIQEEVRNSIQKVIQYKCNFVLTGHLLEEKDKKGDIIAYELKTVGQLGILLPSLFSEIWNMRVRGKDYMVQTQKAGLYRARSRLSSFGLLDTYEPADFEHIMKKAGLEYKDKGEFKGIEE